MNIERVALPGIGVCRTFTSATGHRVRVVTHHTGRRDLVHSRSSDPDAGCSLTLTRAEAIALAGLLGVFDIVDPGTATADGEYGDREPATVTPAR